MQDFAIRGSQLLTLKLKFQSGKGKMKKSAYLRFYFNQDTFWI